MSAPPLAAAPGARAAPRLEVDARVVLLLGLVFGVLVWRAGIAGNLLYAGFFGAVLARAGATRAEARRLARAAAGFALLWGGVKLGMDLAARAAPPAALAETALLAARLVALVLLGAALGAVVTPRALGLALASLTRPVLRRSAWKLALSLLLVVHLVPRTFAAFEAARAALRVRRVELGRTRALVLVLEAGARNLASLTWDQALALAARRLDGPDAWRGGPPPRLRDWCAGAAVAAAAAGATLL